MADPQIVLPMSKLSVEAGVLQKRINQDQIIGQFRLSEITAVSTARKFSLGALLAMLIFGAAAAACLLYISMVFLSWALTLLSGFLCLVMLAFVTKRVMVVETAAGKAELELIDSAEACQVFLLSLRQAMDREKIKQLEQ